MNYSPPGRYVFRYSLSSAAGDWKASKAYRTGMAFTNPLLPISVVDAISAKTLPPVQSFCSIKQDSVIVSTIKKADIGILAFGASLRNGGAAGRNARHVSRRHGFFSRGQPAGRGPARRPDRGAQDRAARDPHAEAGHSRQPRNAQDFKRGKRTVISVVTRSSERPWSSCSGRQCRAGRPFPSGAARECLTAGARMPCSLLKGTGWWYAGSRSANLRYCRPRRRF